MKTFRCTAAELTSAAMMLMSAPVNAEYVTSRGSRFSAEDMEQIEHCGLFGRDNLLFRGKSDEPWHAQTTDTGYLAVVENDRFYVHGYFWDSAYADALADKLTEGALLICLASRYKLMIVLFLVMALKETFMVLLGMKAINQGTVISAQWFGKVYTVLVYATVLALLIFTKIPHNIGNIMICVCIAVALFTLIKYIIYYRKIIRPEETPPEE